jgi:hypothetical protein
MNETIQSNSYRGYSESLLGQLVTLFGEIKGENFLNANLNKCLLDFSKFASEFTQKAVEISENDGDFLILDEDGKKNYKKWLAEKISKALDAYWVPLSQAATQYTSPVYKEHIKTFIDLSSIISGYLNKLNQLTGTSDDSKITMDDLVLFFDEMTQIRFTPFTKKALIGVPFRVLESGSSSDEEKLSGIAHELGHFHFWRLAEFNQIETKHQEILTHISASLNKKPGQDENAIRFIRAWFEELFADFIGTKIAGNTYVNSSKEMIIRNNKTALSLGENDQEHVPDILRPLSSIYTIDQNRDSSLTLWKQFFSENFSTDMSTIEIVNERENEDQRDIIRSPEELSHILLDTIDILTEQIGQENKGFFHTNFSYIASVDEFKEKADRIDVKQRENPVDNQDDILSVLDIFLEPHILEAGQQTHTHRWKTKKPHKHTEKRSHSH